MLRGRKSAISHSVSCVNNYDRTELSTIVEEWVQFISRQLSPRASKSECHTAAIHKFCTNDRNMLVSGPIDSLCLISGETLLLSLSSIVLL
ncbi:hypothetical protein SLA2020_129500 [Shorea laevis]